MKWKDLSLKERKQIYDSVSWKDRKEYQDQQT